MDFELLYFYFIIDKYTITFIVLTCSKDNTYFQKIDRVKLYSTINLQGCTELLKVWRLKKTDT